MMLLIVLNVLAVIFETVTSVHDFLGQGALDLFEFVSVVIFTGMYFAHIWVAPCDGSCGFSRWNYIKGFWGLVDLVTVAPYWCQQFMWVFDIGGSFAQHAFIFRIFRVLRILQAEDYIESFTLLDDAWFNCRDSMIACGFMAMMVWVCGSIGFYNFEQGNPRMDGAFDSLTSSMYYSMIFLGGEWGKIDFTPAGKVVCLFYCIIGIALYGIPVGAVFEAFGTVLEERQAVQEEGEEEVEAFERSSGFIGQKGKLHNEELTVEQAKKKALTIPGCKGFTYKGTFEDADSGNSVRVFFESHSGISISEVVDWTAYTLKAGAVVTADSLSKEQVEQYRQAFSMFDKDKDGTINSKELGTVMRDMGRSPTDQQVEDMISEVDADGSGSIEFQEFLTLMAKNDTEVSEEELLAAFMVVDRDGNGFLDGRELRHMLTNLGETIEEDEMKEIIDECDEDGDGQIKAAEFVKLLLRG